MKKKTIITLGVFTFCILALFTVAFMNPTEACACLPNYYEDSYSAFYRAQRKLEESLLNGNLNYNSTTLQFEDETADVWFKLDDDYAISELLYKTQRTISYGGMFDRRQTIYVLISPGSPREVFISRPAGW